MQSFLSTTYLLYTKLLQSNNKNNYIHELRYRIMPWKVLTYRKLKRTAWLLTTAAANSYRSLQTNITTSPPPVQYVPPGKCVWNVTSYFQVPKPSSTPVTTQNTRWCLTEPTADTVRAYEEVNVPVIIHTTIMAMFTDHGFFRHRFFIVRWYQLFPPHGVYSQNSEVCRRLPDNLPMTQDAVTCGILLNLAITYVLGWWSAINVIKFPTPVINTIAHIY